MSKSKDKLMGRMIDVTFPKREKHLRKLHPLNSKDRFFARSASDRNPDWPIWMVVENSSGLNVTGQLYRESLNVGMGCNFLAARTAMALARLANFIDRKAGKK